MSPESFSPEPTRKSSGPRNLARTIKNRFVKRLYLRIASAWPGYFVSLIPDRYFVNGEIASKRSGLSLFSDTSEFLKNNSDANSGDLGRFYFLNLVLEQIAKEGLPGDLAELGVYKGNTAVIFAKFSRLRNKTVYLFDTFKGFSQTDMKGVDSDKKIEFEDTSLDEVKLLVGNDRVKYVVGHFPESTAALVDDHISFCLVHLDCDLYAPMKSGLEYFYPRLVPGGFLILHDYLSLYWDGAEKAVDEFLIDKPERVTPIPDRGGTVVLRKAV